MAFCTISMIRRFAWCGDRKSTRLNSSHVRISYAVFCLKKKKAPVVFVRPDRVGSNPSLRSRPDLAHHEAANPLDRHRPDPRLFGLCNGRRALRLLELPD